jgi:hypothetical protein
MRPTEKAGSTRTIRDHRASRATRLLTPEVIEITGEIDNVKATRRPVRRGCTHDVTVPVAHRKVIRVPHGTVKR